MKPSTAQREVDWALRTDFLSFVRKAFGTLHGGQAFLANWHLEAIAEALAPVGVRKGERLLLTLPPRSLKSVAVSVAFVAWRLGQDPSLRFVCVSYSNELALKHARDFRAVVTSEWYRRAFPRVKLDRTAEHDITTTLGGGRYSTSIGGTLTGRGGDVIIIDDPMKPGEASSEAARAAVQDWYSSTLVSRLDNKVQGDIVVVMQRVHEEDLVGHLQAAGGWRSLKLAAIAPEDEAIPIGKGRLHQRRAGEALDPQREPIEVLARIRGEMGSLLFSAQYLQEPTPVDGTVIRRAWLQHAPTPERQPGDRIVQSWDCGSKDGRDNDYSVCITALVRARSIYLIDVFREKLEFPSLLRAAPRLAIEYGADTLLIEDASSGTQLIQELRSRDIARVPPPRAQRPTGDKRTRLEGVSARVENGLVILPMDAPWLAVFITELLAFPYARHDDQVDAFSQLLNYEITRTDFSSLLGGAFEIRADDPTGQLARDIDAVFSDEDVDSDEDDDEEDDGLRYG